MQTLQTANGLLLISSGANADWVVEGPWRRLYGRQRRTNEKYALFVMLLRIRHVISLTTNVVHTPGQGVRPMCIVACQANVEWRRS